MRLANDFLESSFRETLPRGYLELKDSGMVFVSESGEQPIQVRCTSWGDFVVAANLAAQERSNGFVVGLVHPKESRLIDNSFFKNLDGQPLSSAGMAELTLHELTHACYKTGTVSLGKAVRYYAESIFLVRYRNHSMEQLAFQTTEEFREFLSYSQAKDFKAAH